jgi:hypothetical protein
MADKNYVLDKVWAARLPKMWNWMRNLRVSGVADFKNTEEGCSIAIPQPQTPGNVSGGAIVIEAKLTARDGTDHTLYDWSQARRTTAGAWEVIAGGRSGSASDVPAIDVINRGDLTNAYVVMARGQYKDATPKIAPCWYIIAVQEIESIPVSLSSTGGVIGTQTTASTWVYTATNKRGVVVGTSLSPAVGWRNGALTAATEGIGYFDSSGDFHLQVAFETSATGGCGV